MLGVFAVVLKSNLLKESTCISIIIVVLGAYMVHNQSEKSISYNIAQMNQLYHLTLEVAPQIFSTQGTGGWINFDWWR